MKGSACPPGGPTKFWSFVDNLRIDLRLRLSLSDFLHSVVSISRRSKSEMIDSNNFVLSRVVVAYMTDFSSKPVSGFS